MGGRLFTPLATSSGVGFFVFLHDNYQSYYLVYSRQQLELKQKNAPESSVGQRALNVTLTKLIILLFLPLNQQCLDNKTTLDWTLGYSSQWL